MTICRGLAPSMRAASMTSSDTWTSPAYTDSATNGTDIQTMTTEATKKKDSGCDNHAYPWNPVSPTWVSSQLMTPVR